MSVERIDYVSEEDYQNALQEEAWIEQQNMEAQQAKLEQENESNQPNQ